MKISNTGGDTKEEKALEESHTDMAVQRANTTAGEDRRMWRSHEEARGRWEECGERDSRDRE